MTLNDLYTPSFKVTPFFDAEYLRNCTTYRHMVWLGGNALVSINVVALCQTRLVPG